MTDLKPITEVVEFAKSKFERHPLSVASGGERGIVERTLSIIGVSELFPIVVVTDDVPRGKPHPDMFLLAAEKMGVRPVDCLVIEDSPLGILAAERAGMGSVLLEPPPMS
jgi:beta-phosphoglucomutase-like phosphatase (HAD superfamily)